MFSKNPYLHLFAKNFAIIIWKGVLYNQRDKDLVSYVSVVKTPNLRNKYFCKHPCLHLFAKLLMTIFLSEAPYHERYRRFLK
jgi:hypothetical protein